MRTFKILTVFVMVIVHVHLSSCQYKQKGIVQTNTIDSTLQVNATSTLEHKLSEINALSRQVIIMEVQTGYIKALVGLTRKDSANYQPCRIQLYNRQLT